MKYLELYVGRKDEMMIWYNYLCKYCVQVSYAYDYSTIKLLGKGNFAKVYYARRKENG